MPQVDLETLVSACAGVSCDKKIACETLANDAAGNNNNSNPKHETDQPEIPHDFPPESFWLAKDAELDWFDRNAFYERKESQKGNSNPISLNPNPSSNSQRFSSTLKSKASFFALPKPQKAIVDTKCKRNCKRGNTQWFPKRTGSAGKSDAALTEPSSPKVSCIGRVRSKRDRRRLKKRQGSSSESGSLKGKSERKEKSGLFSSFRMIFRSGKKGTENETRQRRKATSSRKTEKVNTHDIRDRLRRGDNHAQREESPPRKSVSSEPRRSVDGESVGLGGMKRFTSGRRSDSWIGDVA